MKKFAYLLCMLIILAFVSLSGACSPMVAAPSPEVQTPQPMPSTPVSAPAVEVARQTLAQQLGVPVEQLDVFSVESRQFPNSCLGLPQEDEMCAEVIIQGYQGVILGEGVQYEFRVSEDGSILRFLPGAVLSAQQLLAAQLGKLPEEIRVIRYEAVEWQDACLGIETPGILCAQVITPGFRVILEAEGKQYVFHTDLSGSDVRLALGGNLEGKEPLLRWEGDEGGVCQTIMVQDDVLAYGQCELPLTTLPFVGRERRSELETFRQRYAPFEAQTPAGKLTFRGQGTVTASPVEQRMLAEWARQLWMEFDPQAKPSTMVVIAFHREGGIAGICEDVLIYRSGMAEISTCRPAQTLGVNTVYLTAAQIQQIYRWADNLMPFESTEGDLNVPDGMYLRLVFNGKGQTAADESEQQSIRQLAQEISDQAHQIQDAAAMEAAKQALAAYFEALNREDYQQVINLYGGSYDVLADMNPDLTVEDRFTLWTRACQQNGFVCNLTVRNWVQTAQLSPDEFRFTVELQNPDGTLFVLGPCCGAEVEDFPPMTQFDFVVKRVGQTFLVQSLPIYVP